MTVLKPAHEAFCLAYCTNPNATEAARSAGYVYENASQQGYRLLRRPAVARRLAELRAELVERECLPEALLAKLEAAFRAALKKDQPAAAARIVEIQAKLGGLLARPSDAAEPNGVRAAITSMAKQLGLAAPQFEAQISKAQVSGVSRAVRTA